MAFGICTLPIIPLRAAPSHKSEMISQLLFGEDYAVLDQQEAWLFVRLAYDGYEGWIDAKQHTEITSDFSQSLRRQQAITDISTHALCIKMGYEESVHLLPGSVLPACEGDQFSINGVDYLFLGLSRLPTPENFTHSLLEVTEFYRNAPYLWGGRSLYGIDCSGFSQMVYKHFGIVLPRDAWQQAQEGQTVDSLKEVQVGDLAFFDSTEGKITHVGILLNDQEIVHASGRVQVDLIDEQGIYCKESKKYTHTLRIVKRML